jgi:hypothetical protein
MCEVANARPIPGKNRIKNHLKLKLKKFLIKKAPFLALFLLDTSFLRVWLMPALQFPGEWTKMPIIAC